MRGGPQVPDNAGKEEGGSERHPKGPGGEGDGGVGWGGRGTGRRQQDGARGQEGGLSAQTGRGGRREVQGGKTARERYAGPTRGTRGRSQRGGRSGAARQQRRGRGEGGRGSEGCLSCRHGTCKGEVGEEGVQDGETMRERERMGLGSNMVHTRERRGEAAAAAVARWQAREKGGQRGIRGADTVCARERWGGPRQRDDERGSERGPSG